MKILVFNVGSSSIKYSLFNNIEKVTSGVEDRLKEKKDFQKAVDKILSQFKDEKINRIAHRIVHGGDLNKPTLLNENSIKQIQKFSHFAPLHNPKQLMVVEICKKFSIPQYAVFDTAFYTTLNKVASTYSIPKEINEKYNIKRYGFHGTSHKFVSKNLKGKTITCHLGSGVSVTAIENNKAIDTTMGLTPLEGIIMGTRCGSIDPGLVIFLDKKGYNTEDILTNKSGLKGLTKGLTDFRDILSTMQKNPDSKLAYDIFVYQLAKQIGAFTAALNGLDNLVFTASIGENVPKLRQDVCDYLTHLGIILDKKANQNNEPVISNKNSKTKVHVIKTNEELEIAEEVLKLK